MKMLIVSDSGIKIERLQLGPWDTNAYTVTCLKTRQSALVDAPADADKIIESLKGTSPRFILLTHNHTDHVGALAELRSRLKVPLAAHTRDSAYLTPAPDKLLSDGDTLILGKLKLEVMHTPGHTPGSLCFRVGRYLLAGDTIFPGGPGHTGKPSDFKTIVKSLTEKIFILPDDTEIYPGHGDSTVLKKAKEEFAAFSTRPHAPNLCGDVLWLSS
jgi:glyoxylase-like metal-dependent hydrolase (beta-lactamase superfamily II)